MGKVVQSEGKMGEIVLSEWQVNWGRLCCLWGKIKERDCAIQKAGKMG